MLRRIIALPLLVFSFFLASSVFAEITITEIRSHTFPDSLASDKTARLRVTWKNQLKGVKNTTVLGDYFNAGEFLLASDSNKTFTVNMSNVADIPDVELKTFQFRYQNKTYTSFPVSGLPNPGSGTPAFVGMRILWKKTVEPGDIAPSYEITITEDP